MFTLLSSYVRVCPWNYTGNQNLEVTETGLSRDRCKDFEKTKKEKRKKRRDEKRRGQSISPHWRGLRTLVWTVKMEVKADRALIRSVRGHRQRGSRRRRRKLIRAIVRRRAVPPWLNSWSATGFSLLALVALVNVSFTPSHPRGNTRRNARVAGNKKVSMSITVLDRCLPENRGTTYMINPVSDVLLLISRKSSTLLANRSHDCDCKYKHSILKIFDWDSFILKKYDC